MFGLSEARLGLRHAAARVLLALATGIAIGRALPLPWWVPALVAFVALAGTLVTRGLSLYLAVLAAGALYVGFRKPVTVDPSLYAASSFVGVVVEEPAGADYWAVVVSLDRPWHGKVRVWSQDSLALKYGDMVRISARVRPLDYPRNPGLPDRNEYYQRQGFVGTTNASASQVAVIGCNRGSVWLRLVVMPLGRFIRATFARYLPPAEAGLMNGLLLGGSAGLPEETRIAFTDAGILHILAVSGMNVAIVIGVVWTLLAVAGIRGWWRFGITLAVVVLYVSLCGWSAAPARAGLMAMLWLLGMQLQRRVSTLATLCSVGIVLLLIDPLSLFDVGAQLSFVATAGIVIASERLGRIQVEAGFGRWLKRYIWLPMGVSMTATVVTAPLLLHHFYRVQPLAFLSTFLVSVLVGLAVPLGLLVLVARAIWAGLAGIVAQSLWLVLWFVLKLGTVLGRMDWAIWEPGRLAWPWVLWCYATVLLLLGWQRRWARRLFLLLVAIGVGFGLWSYSLRRPVTEAVFLDPDRGDAVILSDSLGRCVLFDAGIDGPGILRDFLRSRGVHRIAAAVVTHPDRDHYGGLLDLPERVKIERLLVPTLFSRDSGYDQLLARLRAQGTVIEAVRAGDSLCGFGFSVRFVAPQPADVGLYEAGLLPTNSVSLVARVEHAGFVMLLTGDAEGEWWRSSGQADLLKSPHHGSRKGNPDSLFLLVQPKHVVVMGRYPTPARLEQRFADSDIDYINTRRDGGFIIRFGPNRPSLMRMKPALTAAILP